MGGEGVKGARSLREVEKGRARRQDSQGVKEPGKKGKFILDNILQKKDKKKRHEAASNH